MKATGDHFVSSSLLWKWKNEKKISGNLVSYSSNAFPHCPSYASQNHLVSHLSIRIWVNVNSLHRMSRKIILEKLCPLRLNNWLSITHICHPLIRHSSGNRRTCRTSFFFFFCFATSICPDVIQLDSWTKSLFFWSSFSLFSHATSILFFV